MAIRKVHPQYSPELKIKTHLVNLFNLLSKLGIESAREPRVQDGLKAHVVYDDYIEKMTKVK